MSRLSKNEVINRLNTLKEEDIYSLLLFALAEMKNIDQYKVISELPYIFDKKTLLKFLNYYGGMTIRIPTISEFKLVINTLLLYEYVNLEHMNMEDVTKSFKAKGINNIGEIKDCYGKLANVLDNYDFNRRVPDDK